MTAKITDEGLLEEIHRLADDLGRPPKRVDMRENGKYSNGPYERAFGGWNAALEAAGCNLHRQRSVTDEELISALQTLSEELGRAPTANDAREADVLQYSSRSYLNHFGTWNAALREAGLEPSRERGVTKEDLLEDIHRLRDELGDRPTATQMRDRGNYSSPTYRDRFGSWVGALKAAGYEPHLRRSYTRDDLIEDMQRVAKEHGDQPRQPLIQEYGSYSVGVYKREFGSWSDAKRAAGFSPLQRYDITDRELLDDLQRLRDELGHPPFANDVRRDGEFSIPTYTDRFGGWDDVMAVAGMEPSRLAGELSGNWVEDPVQIRYGPNWPKIAERARRRDGYACRSCGAVQGEGARAFPVHHIQKFKKFDDKGEANQLPNLLTLCNPCHAAWEWVNPILQVTIFGPRPPHPNGQSTLETFAADDD